MKPKTAYRLFKLGILGCILGLVFDGGSLIVVCGYLRHYEQSTTFLMWAAYHLVMMLVCISGKESLEEQYEKKDLE